MSTTATLEDTQLFVAEDRAKAARPRLGFLGVGWIGQNRLTAMAQDKGIEVAAVADANETLAQKAASTAPEAQVLQNLEQLLTLPLDGLVIATPSALHADQAITALQRGVPVFCQKPLGRNGYETQAVVAAARRSNRLLGVDFSYRFLDETQRIRRLITEGQIGEVYAVDLVFHNAYGPDKAWFYDWKQSGGGCVIDLGIHLVDLALWTLNFPQVKNVSRRLFAQGNPILGKRQTVEDFATARLDFDNGATVQLACSWKLSAGCDAVIAGTFYGTKGGLAFRNLNGSFYHFVAERFLGTKRETLVSSPENWGGRAAVDWARRLTKQSHFDSQIEGVVKVAEILDAIYET